MYVTTLPRASRNPGLAGFLFGCRSAGLGWGNKRRPGGLGQLDAPTIDIGAPTIAGPLDISSPAPLAPLTPIFSAPVIPATNYPTPAPPDISAAVSAQPSWIAQLPKFTTLAGSLIATAKGAPAASTAARPIAQQAGVIPAPPGSSWFTQSTVIAGLPNWALVAIPAGVVVLGGILMRRRK